MKNKHFELILLAVSAFVIASCGGDSAPESTNDEKPLQDIESETSTSNDDKEVNNDTEEDEGTKFDIYGTDYSFTGPNMSNYAVANTQRFHQTDDCYYVWTYMFDPADTYEDGWNQVRESFLNSFSNYGNDLEYSFESGEQVDLNGIEFTKFSGTITGKGEVSNEDLSYYTYGYFYYLDNIPGAFQVIDLSRPNDESKHSEMNRVIDAMASSVQKD